MGDLAISAPHLTKTFGEGEARTVAVDDVRSRPASASTSC
jgi:hypothetical protein